MAHDSVLENGFREETLKLRIRRVNAKPQKPGLKSGTGGERFAVVIAGYQG